MTQPDQTQDTHDKAVEAVARFRKKPIVIDAVQLPLKIGDVPEWVFDASHVQLSNNLSEAWVDTLEGRMTASPGDWLIRGVLGEIYPCKPDLFEAAYEPVSQSPTSADGGGSVGDGWKLVPIEPTPMMLKAAQVTSRNVGPIGNWLNERQSKSVYAAMLKFAAPTQGGDREAVPLSNLRDAFDTYLARAKRADGEFGAIDLARVAFNVFKSPPTVPAPPQGVTDGSINVCPACKGSGEGDAGECPCAECRGTGWRDCAINPIDPPPPTEGVEAELRDILAQVYAQNNCGADLDRAAFVEVDEALQAMAEALRRSRPSLAPKDKTL